MKHRIPEIFKLKAKPGPGFCIVKGCRKKKAICSRGHVKKLGLCHGHFQHAWRLCNEKQSAYATLRDHAEKRGIKFTISAEYFAGLCDAYGFFQHSTDEFKDYLSIDRVRAELGYQPGNIRVMRISANAAKGNKERHLPATVREFLAAKREQCQSIIREEFEPF